jgi:4-amino-4-deoxy-L-arabinose transferase-like glycosyltransferase
MVEECERTKKGSDPLESEIERAVRMVKMKITWNRAALSGILLVSGFLGFFSAWNEGYGNPFYAAGVKSMLTSWHNFFFASFDPGGYVTIDKPPVALWLQALSAWIFGFKGWSLILPQALAAMISVALVYYLVKRGFGKTAGLLAALAMALTPIVAAVSRTNELDMILVMVVLFAAWALLMAAERGSFKLLLVSVALVGLGFNVKMLEAFMVLPACYLVYLLAPSLKFGKKLLHLLCATVLLLVVSLSWVTVVDLTPAAQRPYVDNSTTNSELELAIGYNGLQRVLPRNLSRAQNSGSRGQAEQRQATGFGQTPEDGAATQFHPGADVSGGTRLLTGDRRPGGMTGAAGEGGSPSIFRIFNKQLAGQIIWLFPLALLGLLAAALRLRRDAVDGLVARRQQLWFWGLWIAPMLAYFSISGNFRQYYMVMLAPGLAALVGLGAVALWTSYTEKGWQGYLLPSALVANAALQACMLLRYPGWDNWLLPVAAGLTGASAAVLILMKLNNKEHYQSIAKWAVTVGIAALIVSPAVWSITPIIYGTQVSMPYAGPELLGSRSENRVQSSGSLNANLVAFLVSHNSTEKFLVAVPNASLAEPIILATGKPVMAVGGFSGRDDILTVAKLRQMVKDGEIRYFMLTGTTGLRNGARIGGLTAGRGANGRTGDVRAEFGFGPGMMGTQNTIDNWVKEHGVAVPSSDWSGGAAGSAGTRGQGGSGGYGRSVGGGMILYDLQAVS